MLPLQHVVHKNFKDLKTSSVQCIEIVWIGEKKIEL